MIRIDVVNNVVRCEDIAAASAELFRLRRRMISLMDVLDDELGTLSRRGVSELRGTDLATDLGMLLIEKINREIHEDELTFGESSSCTEQNFADKPMSLPQREAAAATLPDVTPEQLYEDMLIEEAGYAALEELEEQEQFWGDEYWPARNWREEPID